MVVRGVVVRRGCATARTGTMIVRRRNTSLVIPESQAKLSGNCRHALQRYRQREYRHQKQPRPTQAVPSRQQERPRLPPRIA